MSRREVITCDCCGKDLKEDDNVTSFKIEYDGRMWESADACLDCQAQAQQLFQAFFDKAPFAKDFKRLSVQEAKESLKRMGIRK